MKKRVDWNKFRAAGPSAEYNERVREPLNRRLGWLDQ
jgi:hypothetical protein